MGETSTGWALRAADAIIGSLDGAPGFPLGPGDVERGRRVLARVMVRERLLGQARGSPGPAWTYRVACGESACPECGLALSDHPADPEDPYLTLTCLQGRVKL